MFGSKLIVRPTEALTHEEKLALSLTEILKVRTANLLEGAGVMVVSDFLEETPELLMEIPNFGRTSIKEVRVALNHLELKDIL